LERFERGYVLRLVMADRLFTDEFLAGVYDAWHPRAVRDDFDFYWPWMMAASSILDVGCGTGMMLHALRDAGHAGRLCGLDPAEGMLMHARRRADIEWVLGDLAASTWADEFDLVVMTGHAFQALVSDEDIDVALRAIRRSLTDSGRFAFETRNPAARAWERWNPDNAADVILPDGDQVRITTQVTSPFDGHTVSFAHAFTGENQRLPLVSSSTLRFLDRRALARGLAAAGLRVEAQYGDWNRATPSANSPEIITIAMRA